jgi:GNAT superfamily N-acetyltransferase
LRARCTRWHGTTSPRRRTLYTVPLDELLTLGWLQAVRDDDERLWLDCDLAGLAEHRLGDATDPRSLTPERRSDWVTRATTEAPWPLARRSYERGFWLVDDGVRVGTLALSTHVHGGADVRVSSFYVFPDLRGDGVGRRALRRLGDALAERGFAYRLDTAWSWRRIVRFYQHAGLWVYMWKRDLVFCWRRDTPPPIVEVGEREATLSVRRGDTLVTLARARYDHEYLELDAPPKALADDPALGSAYWHADSTLALALAMEAKPLIRSAKHWKKRRHDDAGSPEALAYKISIWEAFDRAHGWRVDQPKIPGVEYPTWETLEARWEAANAAFEAKLAANGGVLISDDDED